MTNQVQLKWYPGFGATKNEVYFGTSSNADYDKIATINGVPAKGGVLRAEQSCANNVSAGQTYYWYVKATIGGANDVNSDVWSFDAVNDYKLVFNTSDVNDVNYPDEVVKDCSN